MKVREPAVAGTFYPGTPEKLRDLIAKLDTGKEKEHSELQDLEIIGGIVPHAGYIYSGNEAVHFFSQLTKNKNQYETVVILNPNHQGNGPAYALDIHDYWKTPLGNFEIDHDLLSGMNIPEHEPAHRLEHSAEVMLPFLSYYLPYKIRILPVSMMRQNPEVAREIANILFHAVLKTNRKILIIASSDFCHFVAPDTGYRLDSEVIDAILNLSVDSVYNRIVEKNITVCGYGPIMALMEYSMLSFKNTKVRVLARGNSAKSKPIDRVVDYVTILFYLQKDQ